MTTLQRKVLGPKEGLKLQSGPGRDLIFKVTGEDTGGAFDYFTVEVAPHGGPPLHVHHTREETIHVLSGRFKVQIGEQTFELEQTSPCTPPAPPPPARRRTAPSTRRPPPDRPGTGRAGPRPSRYRTRRT